MMDELERTGQGAETVPLDELWEGDMVDVAVDGTNVLVLNIDGDVHAYVNKCAHQAQKLDEGDLDGKLLTCPHHLWTYDATTGTGVNPDDSRLVKLPCWVAGDGVIRVDVTGVESGE